jgi:hypothetical protein
MKNGPETARRLDLPLGGLATDLVATSDAGGEFQQE